MAAEGQVARRLFGIQADRLAGVEADEGRPGDQRIVVKTRIPGGVRHHQRFAGQDGVAAEGQVARRLFGIQADTGLEPLAVVVDQTDQHGLHPEGFPRQFHQGVQVVFGGGVDQRHVVQGLLAQGFVGREGAGEHTGS